jgi:hypothetical protein
MLDPAAAAVRGVWRVIIARTRPGIGNARACAAATMPTLVLSPRYTDDTQALWRAATAAGWQVERLAGWRVPPHLRDRRDVVLHVEALFAPMLAEAFGLALSSPPEDWLVRLPAEYRRREIRLATLGEARSLAAPAFVKPPNDKSFPAAVYAGGDLPRDYDDAMTVLVSEIVAWEREYRCFVLDRRLMTFSIYSRHGEPQQDAGFRSDAAEDDAMRAFVDVVLADPRVDLPRAAVLDVGVIAGRGWACVEQNAAWGAGIYGCDPRSVLEVIRHAVMPRD